MIEVKARIVRKVGLIRRWARKVTARTVYSIPTLSASNPRGRISTVGELCPTMLQSNSKLDIAVPAWRHSLLPPEMVHRKPALGLDDVEDARFNAGAKRYQCGLEFTMPEVSLACFANARVFSKDFLVITSDNKILFESALLREDLLEANGVLDSVVWPKAKRSLGAACLLGQNSPDGYYHWLIEVLPKLMVMERFPEFCHVPLILSYSLLAFQRESLGLLGVPLERVMGFKGDCWKFERLYFPMLLGPTGCPSPHAVQWLRERFLKCADARSAGPKRIYLSRSDAAKRRVLNEDQIVEALLHYGFEVICPGKLSFAEQVGLFRNAEVVVAAHGASVTNMVFAPPGAKLVELFGDNYINGCYWALANICGQEYYFLTGPSRHLDYTISVERLERILARIFASQPWKDGLRGI